ncbi:tetratricopeptide repeat protein [Acidithiobacillus ferrianus]|uniref:Tetratricopeptide repeat protein n=2 Tax=Acidithiobacillus ferrianus TaxID=2678518 RepID=A0A845U5Q3_9PROT|nr:tetratricopeptide repeat protein [Acidithiobacillus ferrianus]NDU41087.1 tetratricopeptide repeat protein [Acidithiobacillus ferrianus]
MKLLKIYGVATLLFSSLLPLLSFATDWWDAPGSLSKDAAGWLRTHRVRNEIGNAFAANLQRSLKSGKGLSYLDQGGISPNWYHPPLAVEPFPGAYHAKLYDLAYQAFLQSHQLENAYRVAWTAVHKNPDSPHWRKRLIRVAAWLGQREEELRQWRWLAAHGDATAQAATVTLAVALARPDVIVGMLSPAARDGTLSDADWKTLIFAYGELGQPNKAVADINAALRHRQSHFLLEQKAYLTYQMGRIGQSLAALQQSDRIYGSMPATALREAQLLAMKGQFSAAMAAMRAAEPKATLGDVDFWRLYAVLAWTLNEHKAALAAEKRLYLLGAANRYDVQRLIMLTQNNQPQAAFAIARQGWRQFRSPLFFFESISLAANQAHWRALARLLKTIPRGDPLRLRRHPAYWIAEAQLAIARKDLPRALADYAQALDIRPGDTAIQADLIWLLIDQKDEALLRALLIGNLDHPGNLRNALINAAQVMHRPQLALYLQQEKASGPDAILNQADILSDNDLRGRAWSLRRQVAVDMTQHLHLLARALAAAPTGGNGTLRVMLAAARKGDYLPAISWSMAQGHWDLARALMRTDPQPVPDWVRLSLALRSHDLDALATLVAHPHRLSPHDLIRAYVMLGDYARAQYWAFQRLQDNPRDQHLRQQYLEVVSHNASVVTLGTRWLSFSGLQRYATILHGKLFIGPNWGLLLRSAYHWQTADTASFLTGIPAREQSAETGFFLQNPLWRVQAYAGQRDAMRHFLTGDFSGEYALGDGLSIHGRLGLHRRATQSPALAVAGMKNDAQIQIDHNHADWSESLYAGWTRYEGQDGTPVGSSRFGGISVTWHHHWGAWGYALGPFANMYDIHRAANVTGLLAQTLLPTGRDVSNVLAGSYADYGLHFSLGSAEPALNFRWTPYLAVSVYNNTLFGFQYLFSAGMHTPLWGPDELSLSYSQGQGGNALALNQREVHLSYTYYFSP